MASSKGRDQVKKDEGSRDKGYLDSEGILTIGVGFNLKRDDAEEQLIMAGVKPADVASVMKVGGKSLTPEQIDTLLQTSFQKAEKDMRDLYPTSDAMPQDVKDVLINMSFQMGKQGLRDFSKMNKAIGKGDWKEAKKEMGDSLWAKQTPSRSKRLQTQMGNVKQAPQPPKSALGKAKSAKELYKKEVFDKRVRKLAEVLHRDSMIKQLAASITTAEKAEAVAEPENLVQKIPKTNIEGVAK